MGAWHDGMGPEGSQRKRENRVMLYREKERVQSDGVQSDAVQSDAESTE